MKFYYSLFVLLVIGAVGLLFVFRAGWYPLVLVNSNLVWAREVDKNYQLAFRYYEQALITYKATDSQQRQKIAGNDLRRAIVSEIIDRLLVKNSLKVLTKGERDNLVAQKINKYLRDPRLEAAALTLFNLNPNDFREVVLVPQAEREILKGQLATEGRDLTAWLAEQKKQAKIYFFTNEFEWNDGTVVKQPR